METSLDVYVRFSDAYKRSNIFILILIPIFMENQFLSILPESVR